MTDWRRLQLAAEGSGTIGLALRRWRHQAEAADFGLPTAATTRWRVTEPSGRRLIFISQRIRPHIAPETLSRLIGRLEPLRWCHAVSCYVPGFPALIEAQAKPA